MLRCAPATTTCPLRVGDAHLRVLRRGSAAGPWAAWHGTSEGERPRSSARHHHLLLSLLLLLVGPALLVSCQVPGGGAQAAHQLPEGGGGQVSAPTDTEPPPGRAFVRFPQVQVVVELARTPEERTRGLSGHDPLGEREGMLFVFDEPGLYAFWMKEMRFALDLLWIEGGKVVHLEKRVPSPPPGLTDLSRLPLYTPAQPARYVLEVNAGFADRHGIGVDTPVSFRGV